MRRRLPEAGRTFDGRKISLLRPAGVGDLYRVAWGNGSSDGPDALGCDWCGAPPGRVYTYDWDLATARTRTKDLPGETFCSLHCWGQNSGYTDL